MNLAYPREPQAGWLLDEVATAGRENLDAGHVARYDGKEDAHGAGEVALLRQLALTDRSVVIDMVPAPGSSRWPWPPRASASLPLSSQYLFSALSQVGRVPVAPEEPPIRERGAGRPGW